MTKKIFTVIGARPQFIKAATVSRAIANEPDLEEIIIHTGQHFDDNMSRIFFQELEIPLPAYNLDIHSLGHGAMTGRMLEKLEELMIKEKPDFVLVYGDTNSTLAGALAASKLHIPVAHVEAGLRSFNMLMPEEVNRILTDRISRILFCPTQTALDNLQKEGFAGFDCHLVNAGDVMFDAALFYTNKSRKPLQPIPSDFILATLHRAENTDNPERLTEIFEALSEVARKKKVVLPLHPRTRKIVHNSGLDDLSDNIVVTEPLGYLNMIWLLKNCNMVMTDSGGLQKRLTFSRSPALPFAKKPNGQN
jgi:UDP-GlcNAc3NAcA epimerase